MLLHDTLKSVVTWHSYKIRCYTTIFLQNFKLFTKSPNTILSTICKNSKYYFSNYLQKVQILFWQIFIKTQYYFGNYLQKPNTILTTIYESPILFWQLLTKAQYYFGNYLQKPNIILTSFIKKPKTIRQTIILLKPKYHLAKTIILYSKPKTIPWQKHIFIY